MIRRTCGELREEERAPQNRKGIGFEVLAPRSFGIVSVFWLISHKGIATRDVYMFIYEYFNQDGVLTISVSHHTSLP